VHMPFSNKLYTSHAQPATHAVLSARLGTGKGGVRPAPDELIPAVLQVHALVQRAVFACSSSI
jgi:hypothetical protein